MLMLLFYSSKYKIIIKKKEKCVEPETETSRILTYRAVPNRIELISHSNNKEPQVDQMDASTLTSKNNRKYV